MIWVIGPLAYSLIGLVGARLIAGHFAWTFARGHYRNSGPDAEQWFGAWCLGVALGCIWPIAGLAWLIGKGAILGAEAEARAEMREKRAEAERRRVAEVIRQSERALGIGGDG